MPPEIYIPREQRSPETFNNYLQSIKDYKDSDPAAIFIVGVNGARVEGNSNQALEIVLKRIESFDYRTAIIHLKNVKMTDNDDSYSEDPSFSKYPVPFDDDVPDMHELLLVADGIVFATSTNWGKQTPRMSLFENHLTPLENSGYLLEGKTCGFIVTGEETGQIGVLENELWVTNSMGMTSPPYGAIYIVTGRPKKEQTKTEKIQPRWARTDLTLAADNMIKMILADRFSGIDWDRRRSREQIKRLQNLLRRVSFAGGHLEVNLK